MKSSSPLLCRSPWSLLGPPLLWLFLLGDVNFVSQLLRLVCCSKPPLVALRLSSESFSCPLGFSNFLSVLSLWVSSSEGWSLSNAKITNSSSTFGAEVARTGRLNTLLFAEKKGIHGQWFLAMLFVLVSPRFLRRS